MEARTGIPTQVSRYDRLEEDLPNIREALAFATEDSPEIALRFGAALQMFWLVRGHLGEARESLQRVLDAQGGNDYLRARAQIAASWIAYAQGDMGSSALLAEGALTLARTTGNRVGTADALLAIGYIETSLGRSSIPPDGARFDRAAALFAEIRALGQEENDQRVTASALHALGSLALDRGDHSNAEQLLTVALPTFEELTDLRTVAWIHHELGRLAARHGN
jgi:hypothetical protein